MARQVPALSAALRTALSYNEGSITSRASGHRRPDRSRRSGLGSICPVCPSYVGEPEAGGEVCAGLSPLAGPRMALLLLAAVLAAGCRFGGSPDRPDGGVVGQVWVSPQCPVVREGEACPDRPLWAPVEGEDPTSGRIVRRLRSDQGCQFEVHLPPGACWIIGLPFQGTPLPRPLDPVLVDVEAGEWERVELKYDSGIR